MAIDTENKRRSALGIWGASRILPVPDNSMTIEDRWHLWLYRGLAAIGSGPTTIAVVYPPICWGYRRQWFLLNGPHEPFAYSFLYNWIDRLWQEPKKKLLPMYGNGVG